MKTIRLKVKTNSHAWLNAAAIEVNRHWNWCAGYSQSRIRNGLSAPSGYDLNYASVGFASGCERITSDTINVVNGEYAMKRRATGRQKLAWRVSFGARRSLGWVPFKGKTIRREGNGVRFAGKNFRVFESRRLADIKFRGGCFAQDAVGDWWLCLPVEVPSIESVAPRESVGIDLGLKTIATTSDGDTLEAGRWTHAHAERLANAQRRGHKRQAKRIHRKAARCRADALHKFSRKIVDQYQMIVIGDVSSSKLAKTRMAKSVLDSGWGILKTQLQYKGEHAGRSVQIVNESYTSVTCSSCGSLSGPRGVNGLNVRAWICADCGESHERDVNAARNILARGKALPSVCGNEVQP